MSGYEEIHILECNRLHSEDYKNNNNTNPATWKNNLGGNLKIPKGSKVELHSAYIGERGCSVLNAMEFKNTKLTNEKKNITYTKITKSQQQEDTAGVEKYAKWTTETITEPIEQFDNKTSITIGFYKNANLENHIFLPRPYILHSATTVPTAFTHADNITDGWTFSPVNKYCIRPYDYRLMEGYNYLRPVADNSRFTCLTRLGTSYFYNTTGATFTRALYDYKDPALADYDYYREKIDLEVEKGFNGADIIAKKLTQQLQKIQNNKIFHKNSTVVNNIQSNLYKTTYYETPTLKFQYGACATIYNDTYYNEWKNNTVNPNTCAYDNSYQFVYFKRPEFVIEGRKLGFIQTFVSISQNSVDGYTYDSVIKLNLDFSIDNLNMLNDFFKIQKLYTTDFFDNDNFDYILRDENNNKTGVSYARFLHINPPHNYGVLSIGGDWYDNSNSTYPEASNPQSRPLFFYFNPDNEDKYTTGDNINDLCYGFATKSSDNKIVLHLELDPANNIDIGIPDDYFVNGSIPSNTSLGYDKHFSAYGNLAMIGNSGILKETKDGITIGLTERDQHNTIDYTGFYMTHFYLGANQPQIVYEDNHFKISDLHTGELTGQISIEAGTNVSTAPKSTDTASDPVYKINKRVNDSLFTPDARPYQEEVNLTHGKVYKMNPNILPWAIFDSHSGIFIEDFGYNEDVFNDGLWGLMGFTYNQFNTKYDSQNNRTFRITGENVYNLSSPTTNAQILSSTHITLPTNIYNVQQFNMGGVYPFTDSHENHYPAISNVSQSMKIISVNLPRKMLKPYYHIRSSIIPYTNYIGGINSNSLLPIFAVVSKINGEGDFYSETGTNMQFIAMEDLVISDITSSIHDPDGSFANVGLDSSILIKITKNINQSLNIIQDIIAEKKK